MELAIRNVSPIGFKANNSDPNKTVLIQSRTHFWFGIDVKIKCVIFKNLQI